MDIQNFSIFENWNKKCKSVVVVHDSFKIINALSNTHDHERYTDQVIQRKEVNDTTINRLEYLKKV